MTRVLSLTGTMDKECNCMMDLLTQLVSHHGTNAYNLSLLARLGYKSALSLFLSLKFPAKTKYDAATERQGVLVTRPTP